MALEESIDGMKKMSSNSIEAYIEPRLEGFLQENGTLKVDYRENPYGGGGYTVTVGESDCDDSSCGGSC